MSISLDASGNRIEAKSQHRYPYASSERSRYIVETPRSQYQVPKSSVRSDELTDECPE
jgi:hypothetical protein